MEALVAGDVDNPDQASSAAASPPSVGTSPSAERVRRTYDARCKSLSASDKERPAACWRCAAWLYIMILFSVYTLSPGSSFTLTPSRTPLNRFITSSKVNDRA